MSGSEYVEALLNGSRRATARLLTLVENEKADAALSQLFSHTGHAHVIGITGAPGTGKSSLVNALAKSYRRQDQTVGIIAVDPTSPFSGGAILGDRIRMRDLSGDPGIFIRSMATRGSLGGLSRTTRDAIRVLDASGFDVVLVETVGAGQSEVDIVRTAQTTVVVEAPGLGDDVQAIKAGIMEIADILVVNKADRPGAKNTVRALRAMLEMGHPGTHIQTHHGRIMETVDCLDPLPAPSEGAFWMPLVVETVATEHQGIDPLVEAIDAHRQYLEFGEAMAQQERQRIQIELYDRLEATLVNQVLASINPTELQAVIERIRDRELDPQTAVRIILEMQKIS